MKLSRILSVSVLALVAAGSLVRAEQSNRNNDDWCRDNEGSRDSERACEVRPVTMAAPSTLDVETSNGSISVTGASRRDISMQVKIQAMAPTESEAKSIVADVKIITDGGTVRAEGPRLSGRRGWWVSYRIEAPTHQNVNLGTSNGSVTITNLDGVLRADTSNGSVHANDVSGDVKVGTSNGAVQVVLSGTTWKGTGLAATTYNGSLRVDMPRDYNAPLDASTGNC